MQSLYLLAVLAHDITSDTAIYSRIGNAITTKPV